MAPRATKTTAASKANTSKKVETKEPVNVLADPVNVLADKKTTAKTEAKKETKKEEAEAKKTTGRKPGRPKGSTTKRAAAVNATTAKRPGRPAGKKNAKTIAAEINPETFVEYQNQQYSENEIMQKVIKAWEAEGKKVSDIKQVKLYVKPEDWKAYYVINEGLKTGGSGAVDL